MAKKGVKKKKKLPQEYKFMKALGNFLILSILVIGVSAYFLGKEGIIGFAFIGVGLISLGMMRAYKIKLRQVYPDIIFGAIDNGILIFAAVLGGRIGGVPGAIIGGRLGDFYARSGKLRGRVLVPLFGILLGVPLLFGFNLIPFFTSTTLAIIFSWIFFLALGFIGNFLANLHQGNTFAIYSEVAVPELRNTANSFNGLMTNFGAIIGNLLISSFIESNFAYLPLAISLVLCVQLAGGFFWLIPYFSYPRECKELRDLMKKRKLELNERTH